MSVLITLPDWSGASWAHELGQLLASLRPAHPGHDGPSWQDAVRDAPGWDEPREITVITSWPAHPDRLADYVASISWVAGLPEAQRAEILARARAVVEAGDTPPQLPMRYLVGLTQLS